MEDIEKLVKTTVEEIEKMLSAKTVVGQPMTIEGATLIPLISVGFFFGTGSGSGKGESKTKREGFGEGSGAGTSGAGGVKPVAVIVIDKEGVRIESIKGKGSLALAVEKVGEALPGMMGKRGEQKKEG